MLAGVPPFQGATAESVLRQPLLETPRPLAAFRPGVPAEMERAVATALAKVPADRWPSGAAFAAALAQGAGPPVRPATRVGRRILGVAAATACVVMGIALLSSRLVGRPAASVAVLCFANLSRDSSDVYLADGLTEEITARLGQVTRLLVKSRTSV